MWIRLLLLSAVVGTLVYFVRAEHGQRLQANKRIVFFGFMVLNVYAVLRPQDVTWVATTLGVGRGTDLLLYLLVVVFVFVSLNFYLRLRQYDRRITELARALALREAEIANRDRDSRSG